MPFQVFFGDKLGVVADAAVEIPDTLVTLHVQVELGFLSEGLVAERASMDTPPMLRPRRSPRPSADESVDPQRRSLVTGWR